MRSQASFLLRLALGALPAALVLAPAEARAADPIPQGADINPFGCLGRYETFTRDRSVAQMRTEVERLQDPLFEPDDPRSIRALKSCVVGMLKSRLGDADASKFYLKAIEENPREPGYELWAGNYYSGFRGARRPVVELAERHYYSALEKLEKLEAQGKRLPFHDVVEDWVHKRLLVLYQEDGMPLLPWKAFKQSSSGKDAPGLSIGATFGISKDTRPFNRRGDNNEMRVFTGEADFANSDVRAGAADRPEVGAGLTPREIYDIPRAPLRTDLEARARVRQRYVGAVDFRFFDAKATEAQVTSFYFPTRNLSDVHVREYGVGYERVLPLYPVMDFRIAAQASRGERTGAVEFLPEDVETYNLYQFLPSFSRFLGTDKLTLDLTYAKLDIVDEPSGPTADRLREKIIRAAELEYALYSPLTLPHLGLGSLRGMRTATRGLYFTVGAMQDDEVYGARTVTKQDFYGAFQFRGPGAYDFTLQGTYLTAATTFADPNDGQLYNDPAQDFSGFRTSAYVEARVIDPDALPGLNGDFLAPDQLTLVFPVSWDKALNGRTDYENIRGGAQAWFKVFGTGFGGPAFLLSAGYDYQYFYQIQRGMHLVSANARLGWGEL